MVVVCAGMPIQDATCGAGAGDVIYVHAGTSARECRGEQAAHQKIYEESNHSVT